MGDEVTLKSVVEKLETAVTGLNASVVSLQLLIVSEYVKKSECKSCMDNNSTAHTQFTAWIMGTYALVIAAVAALLTLK